MRTWITMLAIATASSGISLALSAPKPAAAMSVAPIWDFTFSGDITGSGSINLDVNDEDPTAGFLVTDLNFALDFDGAGPQGPQNVSLANFLSAPLRFNPNTPAEELFSSTSPTVIGWNFGLLDPDGGLFPGGVLTIAGSSGLGFPPAPSGVGGIVAFVPDDSSPTVAGTWTAQAVPAPPMVFANLLFGAQMLRKKRKLRHKSLNA